MYSKLMIALGLVSESRVYINMPSLYHKHACIENDTALRNQTMSN